MTPDLNNLSSNQTNLLESQDKDLSSTVLPGGTFATWAPVLRDKGFWPRPVTPGTKAPKIREWQNPDHEWSPVDLRGWSQTYANFGVGIVTGSPFPDGTLLGALDIDDDNYVEVAKALLRNPISGRIGARGAVFFARVRGDGRYRPFSVKLASGETLKVGELLCNKRFCVLPPTIHPNTEQPYRWIGTPLHEIDYRDLPIIEA